MIRLDMMLAALGSGAHEAFSPVQLQKLMFLIDKNVGDRLGGPFFSFQPYHYGPFDVTVYDEFSHLADVGLAVQEGDGRYRRYRLNDEGRARAAEILDSLEPDVRTYISDVAQFVQKLSFTALVSSIYKKYPEMKVNSVFKE